MNFLCEKLQNKWRAILSHKLGEVRIGTNMREELKERICVIFRNALKPHYRVLGNQDTATKCSVTAFILTLGGPAVLECSGLWATGQLDFWKETELIGTDRDSTQRPAFTSLLSYCRHELKLSYIDVRSIVVMWKTKIPLQVMSAFEVIEKSTGPCESNWLFLNLLNHCDDSRDLTRDDLEEIKGRMKEMWSTFQPGILSLMHRFFLENTTTRPRFEVVAKKVVAFVELLQSALPDVFVVHRDKLASLTFTGWIALL